MYREVPMLQFMTLARFVRIQWSRYDVENSMANFFLERDPALDKWNNIEESVALKIEHSPIPKKIKNVLSSLVKPIGNRIKNIITKIYDDDYLPNHFTDILHWTSLGTINIQKTAQAAIQDEHLSVTKRYEIACTYCLEDEMSSLWNTLPERDKNDLFDNSSTLHSRYILIYWTCYMNEQIEELGRRIQAIFISDEQNPVSSLDRRMQEQSRVRKIPSKYGIIQASDHFNQPAIEYFLGKLSMGEKDKYFKYYYDSLKLKIGSEASISHGTYVCDIIYFLLSQMNQNQRTKIFQKHAYLILKQFLEFPFRGLFLEIESNVQNYLTETQKEALSKNSKYEECFNYFLFRTFRKE